MSKFQMTVLGLLAAIGVSVFCLVGVAGMYLAQQPSPPPPPAQSDQDNAVDQLPPTQTPMPTETPRPTNTPRSTATIESSYADDYIEILDDWSCHDDLIENTVFEGTVRNTHKSEKIGYVWLRVAVVEGDNIINTQTGLIDSDVIYPGGESSFTIYLDNPGGRGEGCRIGVESARWR